MATISHRGTCGFHRDGLIRAEEHLDGPLGAAEVDLEALGEWKVDSMFVYLFLNSLNMS